jgi:hypothetical protein
MLDFGLSLTTNSQRRDTGSQGTVNKAAMANKCCYVLFQNKEDCMQKHRIIFQIAGAMFVFFTVMALHGCFWGKEKERFFGPSNLPCMEEEGDAPCAKHRALATETWEGAPAGQFCPVNANSWKCNVNGSACTDPSSNSGTCHTRKISGNCKCMCEVP